MVVSTLIDMVTYLKDKDFDLSTEHSDGRINSVMNEDEIISILSEKFDIEIPKVREWFDFKIHDEPVNIKITSLKGIDNASSKAGVYYAMTGLSPTKEIVQWEGFLNNLYKNLDLENDKDYYFLVINKNNLNDIIDNGKRLISTQHTLEIRVKELIELIRKVI